MFTTSFSKTRTIKLEFLYWKLMGCPWLLPPSQSTGTTNGSVAAGDSLCSTPSPQPFSSACSPHPHQGPCQCALHTVPEFGGSRSRSRPPEQAVWVQTLDLLLTAGVEPPASADPSAEWVEHWYLSHAAVLRVMRANSSKAIRRILSPNKLCM